MTENNTNYKSQEAELISDLTFEDVLQIVKKWIVFLSTKWLLIFFVGLVGGGLGVIYAWQKPITYISKLTFVVEEGKSTSAGLGGLSSLAGQFGLDLGNASGGGLLSGDNLPLYFKSISLIREVLLSSYNSKQSYADVYVDISDQKKEWIADPKIGDIKFQTITEGRNLSRLQDSLLSPIIEDIIINRLTVSKTDKKAGFVDVIVEMKNEEFAKRFCEKIVSLAVDKYLAIKTNRQKNTVDRLQARLDSIAFLLEKKTETGANLQATVSTMDINPLYRAGSIVKTETTIRDKTLLATIFAQVTQNLELAKFTLSQETPVIQIVDYPYFPLRKNKLSKLKIGFSTSLLFVILTCFGLILNKKMKEERLRKIGPSSL